MSAINIFMEGGGDAKETRAKIRNGMDSFLAELKDAARAKKWEWSLVCCGGRHETFGAFQDACENGIRGIVLLLVDSESAVNASPGEHLAGQDNWDLNGVDDNQLHLMVQTMETWILADPDALSDYFGKNFQASALPSCQGLEARSKESILDALHRATRRTQKGRYHKIRHASELLGFVDPEKAKTHCRHCARLFNSIDATIATE